MRIIECIMTHSRCYTAKTMKNGKAIKAVAGIVVHDTSGGNPYIKRYVQPYEGESNYDSMLKILGKNEHGNDWNHSTRVAGVHAFIGKLADDSIATCKVLPYTQCVWGVGSGKNGSYNYNPTAHIQFEICDDGYKSESYFYAVMKESQEYCAYLCDMFDLSPDDICCHAEAYERGYGSNHSDITRWLKTFGRDMNWYRDEVRKIMTTKNEEIKRYKTVEEIPVAYREDIRNLIDRGYLKGKGDEFGLDLTEDMIRLLIINKRMTDAETAEIAEITADSIALMNEEIRNIKKERV